MRLTIRAANQAIALWLQAWPVVGRAAEHEWLGDFELCATCASY